ncbi:phosphoadenosine phosphosulfate reductase family protein [Nocardiopsis synnemataformans]|uniref:phosphoadenosine phosphosulfate reductase domain-containing protein n=1 Tax=Nocardiopsis synnemataformans TaxID=61305 RepID=UPI003EB6ACD9
MTVLLEALAAPDLGIADRIILLHSGGKDSGAMTVDVAAAAERAGVLDRIVVLHNPLGLLEWPGSDLIAAEHAAHFGLRYEERASDKDLLDLVRARGMWMGPGLGRYCTPAMKRNPGHKFITEAVSELGPIGRQAQVLYCLGLRAQESPARAELAPVAPNAATSGRRRVTTWHPILHLTEEEVWERHRRAGLRWHAAYDAGMSRLSCSLCILASLSDLILACQLRPALATEYANVEWEIGDAFRSDISMIELIARADGFPVDTERVAVLKLRSRHNRAARRLTKLATESRTLAEWAERHAALTKQCRDLQARMRAAGYDGSLDNWKLAS